MSVFKDHFSKQAALYRSFRPGYPSALFEYLASLTVKHDRAWDCATGSGQAAEKLAPFYKEVIATDASPNQIENAVRAEGVTYLCAPAEHSGMDSDSVDLVTVAQALHWFDLEKFYQEVRRVTRNSGVLAVWSYALHEIDPKIDALVEHFYRETVGPYWPAERKWVEAGAGSLPFPFEEIPSPHFNMTASWTLDELLGYFSTWSATQRYLEAKKEDPLPALRAELSPLWGQGKRKIRWPLSLRAGRVRSK